MTLSQTTGFLLAFLAGMMVYWLAAGAAPLTEEEGPIEIWSCTLLFLGAAVSPLLISPRLWLRFLFLPFAFFQLAVRELPVDLWIFDGRVLTAAFYRDQGLSFASVVGVLYAAVAFWSVFGAMRWGLPGLWRAVRDRKPWVGYLAVAISAVIVALGAEALTKAGLVGLRMTQVLHLVEEVGEAAFALALFLAFFVAWRK